MLVDMREARTLREITGRVCETLGVVQVGWMGGSCAVLTVCV